MSNLRFNFRAFTLFILSFWLDVGGAPLVSGETGGFPELYLKVAAGEAASFGNGLVGVLRMVDDELFGFRESEVREPDTEGLAFHLTKVLYELTLWNVQTGGEGGTIEVGGFEALLLSPFGDKAADIVALFCGECWLYFLDGVIAVGNGLLFHLGTDNLAYVDDVEAKGYETDDEEDEGDKVE